MQRQKQQEDSFRAQIAVARSLDLPIIVHARDADEDVAAILENEMEKGPFRGVLHCFSSGAELAERAIGIGLYVSFSGILTFKKAEDLRAIAANLPEDRILVETDSPYLAPMPYRGRSNEPAYTAYTLKNWPQFGANGQWRWCILPTKIHFACLIMEISRKLRCLDVEHQLEFHRPAGWSKYSEDERNRRRRCAVLVEVNDKVILVDAGQISATS